MKSERKDLINRALEARNKLRKAGHKQIVPIIAFNYKDYNNKLSRTRISNVLQGRQADKEITERLEDMVDQL